MLEPVDTSAGVNPDALIARASLAWRAPRRIPLSQWADRHFYLSAESAAEPGRWRSLPYQVGMLDAITDPNVTQISVMKSARVGFTKCLNAAIAYFMVEDPCPIMLVQPTIEDAEGYSKEEIAPMLRDCPTLAELMPESKSRDTSNTIGAKRFPGGSLSMVGANSPRGFRRVSRRVVFFDEVDGYPLSAGAEGDPIKLGIRRTEYYWDRKIAAGSTPTDAGRSRIERLFYEGDQRRYYVPCPHCDTPQVIQFKNFKWPKGKPLEAALICIECGAYITHDHKPAMIAAGQTGRDGLGWQPGPHRQFPDDEAPGEFNGHASFHIWAGYSYSPNASWGQLAHEFESAHKGGIEEFKTYVNTVWGEPWKAKGDAPAWQRLYQRRELYPVGTVPRGGLFLTAGVDVQKDRIVYEVVAWGRGKVSWSIDEGTLPGDTASQGSPAWTALEALLNRQFKHVSGVDMPIAMMAVDSGYNTQTVYNWCRRFPMSRVIAVRGVSTAHVLIGVPQPVDVTSRGRKLKRGYKVWAVAGHVAKAELYGWLRLEPPKEDEPAPPGYVHFPQYGEDWFKQLTAEQLVTAKTRKGYAVSSWEAIPGRENHALDARIYARAAAAVTGLDRYSDGDFDAIDVNTFGAPVVAMPSQGPGPGNRGTGTPTQAAAPEPPPPAREPTGAPGDPQTGGRQKWLRRPRGGGGGWLRRRR